MLELDKRSGGQSRPLPDGYALVGWGFLAVLAFIFAFASWHYDGISGAFTQQTFAQLPPAGPIDTTSSIGQDAISSGQEPTDLDVFSTPSIRSTAELDKRFSAELTTLRREVVQLRRSVSALRELNTNLFARIDQLEVAGPVVTGSIPGNVRTVTQQSPQPTALPQIPETLPSSSSVGSEFVGEAEIVNQRNEREPLPQTIEASESVPPSEIAEFEPVTDGPDLNSEPFSISEEIRSQNRTLPSSRETSKREAVDIDELAENEPQPDSLVEGPDQSPRPDRPVRVIALRDPPSRDPTEAAPAQIAALAPIDPDVVTDAGGLSPIVMPSSKPEISLASNPENAPASGEEIAVLTPSGAIPARTRTTEAPGSVSATRTSFAADLGIFATRDEMVRTWVQLKEDSPDLLESLTAVVHIQENGPTDPYRLLAGPFVNAADAATLCVRLAAKKIECRPSLYLGETLSIE
ncbi:MAG: hypothetical protein ABJN26_05475 [Stappiaceae bacterium]